MRKITEIELFISQERAKTYLDYFSKSLYSKEHQEKQAYELYLWNIKMSGALLEIISFYEVSLRNMILKRLNHYHHSYGIFDDDFIRGLGHKAGKDFVEIINKVQKKLYPDRESYIYSIRNNRFVPLHISSDIPQGLVVADLPLFFWENMLVKRYVNRYWNKYFYISFPYLDKPTDINLIYQRTKSIRKLRNRVCHHEPIINVEIEKIFSNLKNTLAYIDPKLVDVMNEFERVSHLLQSKPH